MFGFFVTVYHEAIYRPVLNLMVGLYDFLPIQDIGLVIILVTIIIRIILAPLMHKSLKGQKALSALQPKMNELREKYKDDREAQAKAMLEMYRENKVNPLSSCLPVLLQLPILLALFHVFRHALNGNLDGLYSFIPNPGSIDPYFLGLVNLASPNFIFAILAGAAQYWQSRIIIRWQGNQPSTDATARMMNMQMTYVLPIISVVIAWNLPAGLPLYWVITTLFAVGQQYYIQRTHKTPEQLAEVIK
ncbi:MAG TPA: YidC/Oxa1 family membrane protein insertase [Candidatus Doudnabacteria bacterium]|nr:YidC/Oxa1 family membrane protein insertase [Candidatus Doudnabacteria bacterium]